MTVAPRRACFANAPRADTILRLESYYRQRVMCIRSLLVSYCYTVLTAVTWYTGIAVYIVKLLHSKRGTKQATHIDNLMNATTSSRLAKRKPCLDAVQPMGSSTSFVRWTYTYHTPGVGSSTEIGTHQGIYECRNSLVFLLGVHVFNHPAKTQDRQRQPLCATKIKKCPLLTPGICREYPGFRYRCCAVAQALHFQRNHA